MNQLISCFEGSLKPVTIPSNGASCEVSPSYQYGPGHVLHRCENALEPFYINNNDWAAECSQANCKNSFLKIILKKSYHIVEFKILQRLAGDNFNLKSVFLTFGNQEKKSYPVYSAMTNYLLEENVGKNTTEILIQPDQYASPSSENIGYNYFIAYAYDDGLQNYKIYFF